jgi:hypothetical protein
MCVLSISLSRDMQPLAFVKQRLYNTNVYQMTAESIIPKVSHFFGQDKKLVSVQQN